MGCPTIHGEGRNHGQQREGGLREWAMPVNRGCKSVGVLTVVIVAGNGGEWRGGVTIQSGHPSEVNCERAKPIIGNRPGVEVPV